MPREISSPNSSREKTIKGRVTHMEDKNQTARFDTFEQRVPANHWTKSNFGAKGWVMIVFVGLMLMFCSGLSNDGLNVAVPVIAAEKGWDYATILAYSTPAGFISVVGTWLVAVLTDKKGARFTTILCLVITGITYIWYGNAASMTQYFIALSLISTFATGMAWVSGGAYLASYFPKKKGLALGWATMGNNLCTAIFVPILNTLTGKMGMSGAVIPIGIAILLLIIFTVFLPNNPEDAGTTPDQIPMDKSEIEDYRRAANSYVSPWTTKTLIRCKEMWLISLVLGCTMLITVGIVGQLVVRLTGDFGWEQGKAVSTMSVCAVIGIVGSYLWGVIDQKIGTKKAVFAYMIWYGIAAFLNAIPNTAALYVSLVMIGVAIGGNANWPVSLVSTVFGYRNFSRVYTLVMPIYTLIRCCAFAVLAGFMSMTGSLSGAYIAFGVLGLLGAVLTLFIDDKRFADGTLGDLA